MSEADCRDFEPQVIVVAVEGNAAQTYISVFILGVEVGSQPQGVISLLGLAVLQIRGGRDAREFSGLVALVQEFVRSADGARVVSGVQIRERLIVAREVRPVIRPASHAELPGSGVIELVLDQQGPRAEVAVTVLDRKGVEGFQGFLRAAMLESARGETENGLSSWSNSASGAGRRPLAAGPVGSTDAGAG